MRGNTFLGNAVHFLGPDLDLDEIVIRPDYRRMQGLIVVDLGNADKVLDPARNGLPVGMDGAQGLVAFVDSVDNDPEGDLVVDPSRGIFWATSFL